ncbi:hypothetical protein D7Y09_16355 [bacterium 1XD42-1]|nr:hypothetical protein D7X25_28810 [bacterium 1XD42-8]RKJ61126.1 hypothetical protein D7Y09_16355 [bacterium 1XD42-1]
MDNEKNTNTQDTDKNIEKSAKEASKLLELIRELKKAGENFNTYTHLFAEPFTYEGKTHEKLTFDWTVLTGKDSLSIEVEMAKEGRIPINAAHSGAYLAGMAVSAGSVNTSMESQISYWEAI